MQYCFTDADSDCFIREISLPVSLLAVKINSSVLKFSMDRYKSFRLELSLHIGAGIPNGVHDWIHMQAKLFLIMVNICISCDDYSFFNSCL